MTSQLSPRSSKPGAKLLGLRRKQRALLIDSILALACKRAPTKGPTKAILRHWRG